MKCSVGQKWVKDIYLENIRTSFLLLHERNIFSENCGQWISVKIDLKYSLKENLGTIQRYIQNPVKHGRWKISRI